VELWDPEGNFDLSLDHARAGMVDIFSGLRANETLEFLKWAHYYPWDETTFQALCSYLMATRFLKILEIRSDDIVPSVLDDGAWTILYQGLAASPSLEAFRLSHFDLTVSPQVFGEGMLALQTNRTLNEIVIAANPYPPAPCNPQYLLHGVPNLENDGVLKQLIFSPPPELMMDQGDALFNNLWDNYTLQECPVLVVDHADPDANDAAVIIHQAQCASVQAEINTVVQMNKCRGGRHVLRQLSPPRDQLAELLIEVSGHTGCTYKILQKQPLMCNSAV